MTVQEGLVYSEDEAVIMVGTLADEHEVWPPQPQPLSSSISRLIRYFQPCPQVAKCFQIVSDQGVFFEVEVC